MVTFYELDGGGGGGRSTPDKTVVSMVIRKTTTMQCQSLATPFLRDSMGIFRPKDSHLKPFDLRDYRIQLQIQPTISGRP